MMITKTSSFAPGDVVHIRPDYHCPKCKAEAGRPGAILGPELNGQRNAYLVRLYSLGPRPDVTAVFPTACLTPGLPTGRKP